jgi:hypothetical protein
MRFDANGVNFVKNGQLFGVLHLVGAYGPAPRGRTGLLGCGSTLELVPAFTFSLDLFLRTDWELITKIKQDYGHGRKTKLWDVGSKPVRV